MNMEVEGLAFRTTTLSSRNENSQHWSYDQVVDMVQPWSSLANLIQYAINFQQNCQRLYGAIKVSLDYENMVEDHHVLSRFIFF